MKKLLKGFTLVEIMLAAAILVAVMAAFLSSFTSTFKSTNYSQGISLAGRAAENKVEEMVNFTFDSLMAQYGANGTGRNFSFNASGLIGAGIVNVTDRRDLYGGGEVQATANAPWQPRAIHRALVYDNKMWVTGGWNASMLNVNDVWYSTNGVNWTCATNAAAWSPRDGHGYLVYNNKMWIFGGGGMGTPGENNEVWYSSNGVNWTCLANTSPWPKRNRFVSLVYDNKMWIMGGYNYTAGIHYRMNDVWYSYDGVNWTCVTNASAWSPRRDHVGLVYDNKMWIMGGGGSSGSKNDVWYSTDGANWTNATNAASWSARSGHASVVYDNKMWIMGGFSTSGYVNDVWYSTDGANWTRVINAATWTARMGHSVLVYDNKMWLMGGAGLVGGPGGFRNDVWSCTGYNRILEASIAVSWRHPDGRQFGEDSNLDGVWNSTTEDANNNTIYDSPARLRQLLVEDSTTGKLRRIYMGR